MERQRRVETVEQFRLRIAALIRAKSAQIPAPNRPRTVKRTLGKTPNELSASATLANGDGECQSYFCVLPLPTTAALQTVAMLGASAIQEAGSAW